jgi:hypothetical protein
MWDAMLLQVPNPLWQVSIIKKKLNEHGGRMGGHLRVQQRKPKEILSNMCDALPSSLIDSNVSLR